jgi:aminocarboxymuconate-semialdehyde decarboxylase
MTTRRDMLRTTAGALAGLALVGCDLLPRAHAQGRRREVVVNGRRAKTVDVHAHCAVPEALAVMGLKLAGPSLRPDLDMATSVAPRLEAMDAQGIDVEALSINPNWYRTDRDVASQVIRIQNEKLAEPCAAHPDRFVAFATVALQFPELAAQQLEEAVKKYGCAGQPSAATWRATRSATPGSTRSGPRWRSWASWSSSTRRPTALWRSSGSGSKARATWAT